MVGIYFFMSVYGKFNENILLIIALLFVVCYTLSVAVSIPAFKSHQADI